MALERKVLNKEHKQLVMGKRRSGVGLGREAIKCGYGVVFRQTQGLLAELEELSSGKA